MAFSADVRNIGGRAQIVDMLNNHHSTLMNMKPTFSTRDPPPQHVGSGKKKKISVDDDLIFNPNFGEVREAFKRVAGMKKGVTNSSKPKTYELGRKLSLNKKRNNFHMDEHLKNLASLQKRIGDLGSANERKKNPYDPLSHPSLFFRRAGENDKTTSLQGYAKKSARFPEDSSGVNETI